METVDSNLQQVGSKKIHKLIYPNNIEVIPTIRNP